MRMVFNRDAFGENVIISHFSFLISRFCAALLTFKIFLFFPLTSCYLFGILIKQNKVGTVLTFWASGSVVNNKRISKECQAVRGVRCCVCGCRFGIRFDFFLEVFSY